MPKLNDEGLKTDARVAGAYLAAASFVDSVDPMRPALTSGFIASGVRNLTSAEATRALELYAAQKVDAVYTLMLEMDNLVEFASKREIASPSNHQDFAREASERLNRWRKKMSELAAARARVAELLKVKNES